MIFFSRFQSGKSTKIVESVHQNINTEVKVKKTAEKDEENYPMSPLIDGIDSNGKVLQKPREYSQTNRIIVHRSIAY